jgi:endonuclease/exonuclease/phosphatase family metal-dependent hydrolase
VTTRRGDARAGWLRRLRAAAVGGAIALAPAAACAPGGGGSGDGDAATAEPDGTVAAPVRVLTLNLLHGLLCPAETDSCQAPDRVQIFAELVEEAGCPDLVGLQEIGPRLEELVPAAVDALCGGDYAIAWEGLESPDRQMVLTRLPVVDEGHLDMANFPWEAYWVRVDSALGAVDFLTAHFASSANNPPCTPELCPPICAAGLATNECHAREVVDFFDRRPPGAALAIAAGDLNAPPGSPTVARLTDAGFVDTWLASGQPECDPPSHAGCTGGGRQPEPFVGMDTPEGPGYDERIDYVLVRPASGCPLVTAARAVAAEPRAEPLNGLWWPSDHAGVLAEIGCA